MSLGEVSMSLTINAKSLGLTTGMALFFPPEKLRRLLLENLLARLTFFIILN